MVKRSLVRRFWREDSGLALTEALLTIPVVLIVLAAMIEFGVAVFQWNQAAKAVQIGDGDAVPAIPAAVSCQGATCDAARLNRLLTGGDGVCGATANGFVGMCDAAPCLTADNVMVTYHRSFLGYVGRPFGQVTTITVELRDVTVDFLFIDDLLGLNNITIPSHPVSMTSEDVCDTRINCY